jgi:hypothetical protein
VCVARLARCTVASLIIRMNRVGWIGQLLYSLKYFILEDDEESLETYFQLLLMGVRYRYIHTYQPILLVNKREGHTRDAYCNKDRNKSV